MQLSVVVINQGISLTFKYANAFKLESVALRSRGLRKYVENVYWQVLSLTHIT